MAVYKSIILCKQKTGVFKHIDLNMNRNITKIANIIGSCSLLGGFAMIIIAIIVSMTKYNDYTKWVVGSLYIGGAFIILFGSVLSCALHDKYRISQNKLAPNENDSNCDVEVNVDIDVENQLESIQENKDLKNVDIQINDFN